MVTGRYPRTAATAATTLLATALLAGCADESLSRLTASSASAPLASTAHVPPGQAKKLVVKGRVLVRFRDGADVVAVAGKHRGRQKRRLAVPGFIVLEVPEGEEEAVAAALAADPSVVSAEVDEMIQLAPCEVGLCDTPVDVFNARYKWDLHNTGTIQNTKQPLGVLQATGKADADIDWPEAFDALGGNAFTGSAVIGILDSGIYPSHVETTGRILAARNFAEVPITGPVDPNNTQDNAGHGTVVATIAAGKSNNYGLTGVAWGPNIKLLNAKVCEKQPITAPGMTPVIIATYCASSWQAEGIIWAVDNGANVLNLSIGTGATASSGSPAVEAALAYARSKNVLAICAAGNDNYPNTIFPARFADCMTVAATNWGDTKTGYSNYGDDVEVSAPGGDGNPLGTLSSMIMAAGHLAPTHHVFVTGTSMAAPQVAGLAALLYASGLTDAQAIRQRIVATADPLPGVTGMGSGRINAYRALTLKEPSAPPVVVTDAPAYSGVEGAPIAFDGSASYDPNNHPITFLWTFGDGATSPAARPSRTYADDGSFQVTLEVTDESNRATTLLLPTTVLNVVPAVNASLSAASILSGQTVTLDGAFTDPGALDAPWTWAAAWGNGGTGGQRTTQDDFSTARQYCAAGTYAVTLSVTDKDGGTGTSAAQSLRVGYNAMTVGMPGAFPLANEGTLPVTIFGEGLDVSRIDVASIRVGDGVGADAAVAVKHNGELHAAIEGGNLVVHVDRQQIAALGSLTTASTQLVVRARLKDGCAEYRGAAAVMVK